jgi:hypothetical protein
MGGWTRRPSGRLFCTLVKRREGCAMKSRLALAAIMVAVAALAGR